MRTGGWCRSESGALRVGSDCLVDFEGEGEGGAAFFGRDEWGGAGSYGVEEGCDLEAEGFAWFYCYFVERQAGGGVLARLLGQLREGGELRGIHCGSRGDVDHEQVLAGEVERQVLAGLEEAEFAD